MPHRPLADIVRDEIVNAAHLFTLIPNILADPDGWTMPGDRGSVVRHSGNVGHIRMERVRDEIIVDIAAGKAMNTPLVPMSLRLLRNDFIGSRLFLPTEHLPANACSILGGTFSRLTRNVRLVFHRQDNYTLAQIGRAVSESEEGLHDLVQLVEIACSSVASMLPDDLKLYRAWAAFEATPCVHILREVDDTIVPHDEVDPAIVRTLRRIEGYLDHVPENLMMTPDRSNPNTFLIRPFSMTYALPDNPAEAVTRLPSVMMRLNISEQQLAQKAPVNR